MSIADLVEQDERAVEDRRARRFMEALSAVKSRGDDGYTELATLNAIIALWRAGARNP